MVTFLTNIKASRRQCSMRSAFRRLRIFIFNFLIFVFYFSGILRSDAQDTRQDIFDPAFRTLKVSVADDFWAQPVISLDSDQRIVVSFDELSDDWSELRYRLIHCNADWTPSRLLESEYLDGFNIADVDDWAFSTNTFVHYVNYRIVIPNESMNPLVSGNYLLQVFDRSDEDTVLLQARFSVSEQKMDIEGEASSRTDRGLNTEWQQLELALVPRGVKVGDPFNELLVEVTQNQNPHDVRSLTTPSRIDGDRIVFSHQPDLIFKAGNEFRRFESIRTNYTDLHVDSVRYVGPNYHVWLTPDFERADHEYSYDQTQQGRFLIREYNSTDSDLGADYITVHFTLATPQIIGADVYVEGEFTDWRRDERTRMRYDHNRQEYRLEIPLKQGSYNYRYTAVPVKGGKGDSSIIEGDKFETRNEYGVNVFYRPVGARADRLLTHAVFR